MADQQPIDDALLSKYLAGETDSNESARVQQWLASQETAPGEPSQADFVQFERIWRSAAPPNQRPIDTDAAWQKVHRTMRQADTASIPFTVATKPERRRFLGVYRSGWQLAAGLLLAAGVGWMALRLVKPTTEAVELLTLKTTDTFLQATLPDGTKILLNRQSTFRYPARFSDDRREVTLLGEAFFEVTPDAQRPFCIRARQTSIQVLGTSFNVRAYDPNVSVAVRTGKVQFASGRQAILLTKNQQATFIASVDTIRQSLQVSPNVFAYKTGQLVFTDEPLDEVVQTLNKVYNADVRLANARLGRCRLTTRFINSPLDTVVAITAETLGLQVRHEGKRVILDGTGCQ